MAVQNIICLFIVLELISSEVVRMCSYVCWLALKRVSVEPKAETIPKFNSAHLPFTPSELCESFILCIMGERN